MFFVAQKIYEQIFILGVIMETCKKCGIENSPKKHSECLDNQQKLRKEKRTKDDQLFTNWLNSK